MQESDLILTARNPDKDRQAFRKTLEEYVPQTEYVAPSHPRILNLGCGKCYEAPVLSGYFGGQPFGQDSDDVYHVGIDQDDFMISIAERDLNAWLSQSGKYTPRPNYEFIVGDAKNLSRLVSGRFDIVVARHPNVERDGDADE